MVVGRWIEPDWPAPARVRAVSTTRQRGHGGGPFATFNLSDYVGDSTAAVNLNRALLRAQLSLPSEPHWLRQVHGTRVLRLDAPPLEGVQPPEADASVTAIPGVVCVVQTADCLPVLLCDRDGTYVAAVHAGWRGLVAGVIEAAVTEMKTPGTRLMAWLGPAIGPDAFEVGDDVRDAFTRDDAGAASAFRSRGEGKWVADLYQLARLRLQRLGIEHVSGGTWCTYTDAQRFYSYRRDGVTGRMATLIWIA
jgi:YfiH family protein